MVPRAVLMTFGLLSINTARPNISKIVVLVNTARQVNVAHSKTIVNAARPISYLSKIAHSTDQGVIDSGCIRHIIGNMSYLTDYEEIDGGYVAFGGNLKGGIITGKENGNAPIVTKIIDGKETVIPPTIVEKKAQIRAELKARSTWLMALQNEHLLKQTYERLQKLISQLEMHGEVIPQEDISQKFLITLSQEWTMHTIMWRNKPEIETLTFMSYCSIYSATRIVNLAQGINTASTHGAADSSTIVEHYYADYEGKKIHEKKLEGSWTWPTKKELGYNAVPPPYTGNFMSLKPDLVYASLDDFVDVNESVSESVIEKPTIKTNELKTTRKENGAPIIKDWVSKSVEEDEPTFQSIKPNFSKIKLVKPKTNRKPVKQIRQDTYRSPRGIKRNWNQQMSQKSGSYFEIFNKACHVCGSFDYLKNDCNNWYNNGRFAKSVWSNVQRVNKQNFSKLTHPNPKRNIFSRTILTRFGPISLNTARLVNIVQPRIAVM
ncbi:hypothetical protein Tco_1190832 [Tanacetum coccineum]